MKRAHQVIFLTVFLDLLGFGLVIPILPLYSEEMHATDIQTGFLLGVYSLMQLFFAPIMGRLSDRAGRRPVLLVSVLGSCISQLGYALAPSFWYLVLARALAGACGANITAAQAYIADTTDEKSRAAGMGMLGAALGLGFIFGPAVGGLLANYSSTLPFFLASGLAAINFFSALIFLQEPRAAAERSKARAITWEALLRAVTTPRLLGLLMLFFMVTFGFANLEATFSLFLKRQFAYGRREASYLFTYIGVIMVMVQGGLLRRLAPAWGERRLIITGTSLMAAGFFLQAAAHTLPVLLLAIGVTAVGNGFNTPSLMALISRAAGGDQQGGILGVSQSLGALARILGPLAGTWLLQFGPQSPYWVGGGIMLVASGFAALSVAQPSLSD